MRLTFINSHLLVHQSLISGSYIGHNQMATLIMVASSIAVNALIRQLVHG